MRNRPPSARSFYRPAPNQSASVASAGRGGLLEVEHSGGAGDPRTAASLTNPRGLAGRSQDSFDSSREFPLERPPWLVVGAHIRGISTIPQSGSILATEDFAPPLGINDAVFFSPRGDLRDAANATLPCRPDPDAPRRHS